MQQRQRRRRGCCCCFFVRGVLRCCQAHCRVRIPRLSSRRCGLSQPPTTRPTEAQGDQVPGSDGSETFADVGIPIGSNGGFRPRYPVDAPGRPSPDGADASKAIRTDIAAWRAMAGGRRSEAEVLYVGQTTRTFPDSRTVSFPPGEHPRESTWLPRPDCDRRFTDFRRNPGMRSSARGSPTN